MFNFVVLLITRTSSELKMFINICETASLGKRFFLTIGRIRFDKKTIKSYFKC